MPTSTFSNPPGLSTPRGYTHVVDVPAGRTLYISGQVAFDAEGKVVGKGDVRAQTEQVFRNLKTAVESAGATMADVVKINWYVRDVSQLAVYREVRNQFWSSGPYPASTLVEVKGLVSDDLLIEVEAIVAPRR
ncbi:MAG TPA: RidA family protein [Myxococcaceae bacterium]|nr:RidA family protein [Myxococcaceae bacterium]